MKCVCPRCDGFGYLLKSGFAFDCETCNAKEMTTAHAHTPDDPRIFVFGSNLLGIHGAGAARYAHKELGAKWGVAEGPSGLSFALPTCSKPGAALPLRGEGHTIEHYVKRFLNHAQSCQTLCADHACSGCIRFFVSAIGTGYAGYTEAEIAPLFANAPENCDLPPGWRS